MGNVILTDLSGISAILPSTEEEKQVYALRRLNVFTPWPLRSNVIVGDCGRDIGIPFLSDCEHVIWAAYLPLFSNTLHKFVFDIDRMGRPKEWLPLEVMVQYETALKLGIFSELSVRVSNKVEDAILVGSQGICSSSTHTRSYLLGHWHTGGRTATPFEKIKDYLRVTISGKCYRYSDFGWLDTESILSACSLHDRLAQN